MIGSLLGVIKGAANFSKIKLYLGVGVGVLFAIMGFLAKFASMAARSERSKHQAKQLSAEREANEIIAEQRRIAVERGSDDIDIISVLKDGKF